MKRTIAMLAAFSLSLAGLVAHAEETKDAAKKKPSRGDDCVFARIVNDFQVLDDHTLAVWAPTRKNPYIVELAHPVPGLKFELSLGFQDRNNDGRICGYGGDSIIVQHPFTDRILIAGVQRVTPEDMKIRLAEAKEKKTDKTQEKTTMPRQEDMKSDKGAAATEGQSQEESKEQAPEAAKEQSQEEAKEQPRT